MEPGRRILLVDDERDFVDMLIMRLHSRNFDVITAGGGREALEKAREKPDLILLDVMLPDISGYEVCHRLRRDKATQDIPIIILTGKSNPEDKIEGLYIGADDYITKPFETEEFFARIEAVLRRSRSFEERGRDRIHMIYELKRIIQEELITSYFQPIYHLSPHKLLGIEVLSRPPRGGFFENSELLFGAAFHLGMLFELELCCHKKALLKLEEKAKEKLIFFNVSPYLIQDPRFKKFGLFYQNYTKPGNVVLELTERTAIKDFDVFFKMLKFFRDKGFKISIDDIGSGYASLNSIVEIKPEFIKIDMHLIRNIDADEVRQNLLYAIVMFCKKSGIMPIAEGIETKAELEVLAKFGVTAGQGYYLGRPDPEIKDY